MPSSAPRSSRTASWSRPPASSRTNPPTRRCALLHRAFLPPACNRRASPPLNKCSALKTARHAAFRGYGLISVCGKLRRKRRSEPTEDHGHSGLSAASALTHPAPVQAEAGASTEAFLCARSVCHPALVPCEPLTSDLQRPGIIYSNGPLPRDLQSPSADLSRGTVTDPARSGLSGRRLC